MSAWVTVGSGEEIAAPLTLAMMMMMIRALVKSHSRGKGILGKYLKEKFCFGVFLSLEETPPPQFLGLYGNPKVFRSISFTPLAVRMASHIQVTNSLEGYRSL